MKPKNNTTKLTISILGILVIILLGSNFYLYHQEKPLEIKEEIKEKALLKIDMYNWGENIENDSELLFNYWVLNYGNTEAKEINIRCKITDEKMENTIFSGIDYYGNLASHSRAFGQILPKKQSNLNPHKDYVGFCYIESCKNCEILHEQIPELNKIYTN